MNWLSVGCHPGYNVAPGMWAGHDRAGSSCDSRASFPSAIGATKCCGMAWSLADLAAVYLASKPLSGPTIVRRLRGSAHYSVALCLVFGAIIYAHAASRTHTALPVRLQSYGAKVKRFA